MLPISEEPSGPSTVVRKKVDERVKTLIENGVRTKHRSFFIVIGDKSKDQVANLHYMLKRAGKSNPTVLWTYKKHLVFHSADRRKRQKLDKKDKLNEVTESFETFIAQTSIRYCFYNETHRILGNTFGMLVIQDFETLTPNLLARTVETVEGGGLVVLLINSLSSLKALYTMTMDVHARYRTSKYADIIPRFNERFLLSFSDLPSFLSVDDELSIVPFTSNVARIAPVDPSLHDGHRTQHERELHATQEALKDNALVGPLIKVAATVDQARLVMDLMAVIVEKERSMRTTVIVTAARGRGKSAALGLAVAGAIREGFANVFVTSPSPENLNTFFFFVVKALEALGYSEKEDFEIHQSANPQYNKAVVRINLFKDHRQTIQYVSPQDSQYFTQAEMLVVDEAAAIPLPLIEKMFGPYLILMASTVSGYEGTGRSLSVKLMQKLKAEAVNDSGLSEEVAQADAQNPRNFNRRTQVGGGRQFKHFQLREPIRYAPGDAVEKWLNAVLCMDPTASKPDKALCPHPDQCELYYVNRDTLFSYHPAAEEFLHRMMTLYVSSHYKNQPNDLQLMSDAPAHHLFVLLPPVDARTTKMPDPLCVIQVCEEGGMPEGQMEQSLAEGSRSSGDLVPFTVSQAFQDPGFSRVNGVRVVRIAVSPDFQRMQYGTRALRELIRYYSGQVLFDETVDAARSVFDQAAEPAPEEDEGDGDADEDGPSPEVLQRRRHLPHLLQPLSRTRLTEAPQYISTSFGITLPLFEFWQKAGFSPVYLRQGQNDLTGEHTVIMLRALPPSLANDPEWLGRFQKDFQRRYVELLSGPLRGLRIDLALSVALDTTQPVNPLLRPTAVYSQSPDDEGHLWVDGAPQLTEEDLVTVGLTAAELGRLSAFVKMRVDIQVVFDLIPTLARLYYNKRMVLHPDGRPGIELSVTEMAVLLGLGLQHKTMHDVATGDLGLGTMQANAILFQALKKMYQYFFKLTHTVREHAPRPKTRRVRKPKVIGETDGAPTAEPLAGPAAP